MVDGLKNTKKVLDVVILPYELFVLILWMLIYWRGTKFEQMYSRLRIFVIGITSIIDIMIQIGLIFYVSSLGIDDTYKQKSKILTLLVTSLFNTLSVYIRYFMISLRLSWYSQFDRDFDLIKDRKSSIKGGEKMTKEQKQYVDAAMEKYMDNEDLDGEKPEAIK